MIVNQQVHLPLLTVKRVSLHIKREDLIHPHISGNKYRKLKYNLIEAQKGGDIPILTFGGAFSNHIAATAYAGKAYGLQTIGIIRGEELEGKWKSNPTLVKAKANGMQFKFVSRANYRLKENPGFLRELKSEFGDYYLLPEGGTNTLAIEGCREILVPEDHHFQVVSCAVGTGGTLAGIIESSHDSQQILGFPVLKGDFLKKDICKFVRKRNWKLLTDYHFGGYAKVNTKLINFINDFKQKTGIPLDPIYTGKHLYGILDLVEKDHFSPSTKILAIHTGGLQGIVGMNQDLKLKNLPLLDL
ncbi:pyridoxal-phosphate dependent enzyme [Flavobacteriaceae bacterium F89]|uniref:Pyridoxal-phosphate dependent enzyme n=1 Tax=Cerina litoralis TaxID=2874477 RepID=A0AAE3ESQ2_9FLAO|nr:pyridoxal-phosphate dependent enzyme [Cerina litoralis]MCG2459805.1 pyridoxal-phosphate dependent enzyme [Cerina litoralis]